MMAQGYQTPGISATQRPISDPEAQALRATVRPARINAIGIACFSILMAIMINFVDDQVAMLLPLVFGFIGLGMAVQARKSAGNVVKVLAKGTVIDVRAVPKKLSGARGWDFGGFNVPRSGELSRLVIDGSPASLTIAADTKHLLSVNGVAMKKPITLFAPLGFEGMLAMSAASQAMQQIPAAQPMSDELPPPPEGWAGDVFCTKCGNKNGPGARFCSKCGATLPKL